MTNTWTERIEKKYSKEGYMDKYGGSVLLTSITLGIFGMLFGYHYFQTDIKALKKDWPNIRCNPLIIPFAGIINAPPDGSKWEYTAENFGHCLTGILKDVVNIEKAGITASQSIMQKSVAGISEAIQAARTLISKIRNIVGDLISSIFNKIINVLMPLRMVLISSLDSLNKVAGVGVTGLYTALAGVLSMRSFVFLFLIGCIFVLLTALAFTVGMILSGGVEMVIPFVGWALAIPDFAFSLAGIIFMIAVLVIFIPVVVIIIEILELTTVIPQHRRRLAAVHQKTKAAMGEGFENRIRPRHFCFDKNTRIFVKGRGAVKITDIRVNDILSDGGKVTAFFRLSHKDDMYEINGIKVTGRHRIDDPTYGCIAVKDHPDSQPLPAYRNSSVYCINTTTKRIPIRNMTFLDYDELDDMDISTLQHMMSKKFSNKQDKTFIHNNLESGITGNTEIELEDGRSVKLSNIKINDQLKFGERVLGIVKIDGITVDAVRKYTLKNTKIIGTNNIKMLSKDLGIIALYKIDNEQIENPNYLYNLITDTGTFMINDIRVLDYHGGLGMLLWNSKYSNEFLTA